jgi:hypothetical protein
VAKHRKERPWELKVTWALSIVMLLLVFGFFYQSYQEMRKIAPVQVAVERITGSATPNGALDVPENDFETEPEMGPKTGPETGPENAEQTESSK